MSKIANFLEQMAAEFEGMLQDLEHVSTARLGLDERAGMVFVDPDSRLIIADRNNARAMNYYGGFEYVASDAVTQVGEYTIWNGELDDSERTMDALSHFMGVELEREEDSDNDWEND